MKKTTTAVALIASAFMASSAFATMEYMKEYKAQGHADAKCSTCHVKAMPKKGDNELNDMGKKVKAAQGADKKIDWTKVK